MKQILIIMMILLNFSILGEDSAFENKRIDLFSTQTSDIFKIFQDVSKKFDNKVYFNFHHTVDLKRPVDVNMKNVTINEILYLLSHQYDLKIEKISDILYLISNKGAVKEEPLKETRFFHVNDNINEIESIIKYSMPSVKIQKIYEKSMLAIQGGYEELQRIDNLIKEYDKKIEYNSINYMDSIFRLNYIKPELAVSILNNYFYLSKYSFDEKNKILFLKHRTKDYNEILQYLEMIDEREKSVMIEIMIVDRKVNKDDVLGFEYTKDFKINGDFKDMNLKQLIPSFEFQNDKSNVKILSKPNIVAKNGRTSKIHIGESYPTILNTKMTNENGIIEKSPNVTYRDVGISVECTPEIYPNEEVSLKIVLDITSIGNYIETEFGSYPSYIAKTNNSELILKSGDAIYFSGLISDEERKRTISVPLLGKIPILGTLFRKEIDSPIQTEILMFMKVTIVDNELYDNETYDDKKLYLENKVSKSLNEKF